MSTPATGTSRSPRLRDGLLVAAGGTGLAIEALLNGTDRPTLLLIYLALAFLPAILRVDESKPRSRTSKPRSRV